jgi:CheY-like chemotaxis protein/DNA-directed RNA polymerase specialized sigma24 family protein
MSGELALAVGRYLPFLRRYARALCGDQVAGDRLVRASLERLLADGQAIDPDGVRVALYRVLSRTWSKAAQPADDDAGQTIENGAIVAQSVARLSGPRRQVLLLATLEGFATSQIAVIMGRDEAEVRHELAAGKQELREQPATRILIIEDEPVIALDISHTVEASGHTVTGIATTHRQAVELAQAQPPGLVLADIHLGDDSSGVDAVAEIMEHYRVPVIFITAFPDRLLTGERPEPTFLITKPFDPEILGVAISQALTAHQR